MNVIVNLDWDRLRKIIKLGRLPFLLGGFLTFSAGALLAFILNGNLSWDRFFLGYVVLLFAHLSASYSNDYFDWEADHYNQPTTFAGGSGVLVEDPDLRDFSKRFSLLLIALSLLCAFIFNFLFSSILFLILAVFSNLLSWYYSAPPIKLAYHGGSEIATMLTGFIFPVLGYVALTGQMDLQIILFTIPFMIYQLLFIISVEIPDKEGDQKAGKITFIVRNGRKQGFVIILGLTIIGTAIFLLLNQIRLFGPVNFNIIAILSLIPLIVSVWTFRNRTSQKIKATNMVSYLAVSLVLLVIMVNIYFLSLII